MMQRAAVLAGAVVLSTLVAPAWSRAGDAPHSPGYEIIRLPDDPGSGTPRMMIFDPKTARLWVLRDRGGSLAFLPVPYVQTTPDGRVSETVQPPPAPPEGTTFQAAP